jgi:hypothetical protein
VQNPNIRNAFFRTGAMDVSVAPALPSDREGIEEICRSTDAPESAGWLIRWLDRHPETFFVARTALDRTAGFYIVFEYDQVDPALRLVRPPRRASGAAA